MCSTICPHPRAYFSFLQSRPFGKAPTSSQSSIEIWRPKALLNYRPKHANTQAHRHTNNEGHGRFCLHVVHRLPQVILLLYETHLLDR